jgi:Na+/melibiose symporter-like transporter
MDNVRSVIRLLALFSIFFIYKVIIALLSKNMNDITLWGLITIVYVISITILFFVVKKLEKEIKS